MYNNNFFFENCAVYEVMWENIVQPDRPQMAIWRMRIACWVSKGTKTHSDYVILTDFHCMVAGTRHMLRYTYTVRLVAIRILYKKFSNKPEFRENRPRVTAILYVECK